MGSNGHVKIVLPCSREGEWARITVESILGVTVHPSFEIAISANGDDVTDFSFIDRPPARGRVRLIESPEPLGVARARNAVVEPGDADFYVFLDAHCIVEDPGWLSRCISCLEEHPEASLVQPEVLTFIHDREPRPGEGLDRSEMTLNYADYSARWAWPYDYSLRFTDPQFHPIADVPHEAMAGTGGASFVRAATFHRLGRFDEEVGGWFHETMDYCLRAWLLGHPMIVEPRVRILHRGRRRKPVYPATRTDAIHGMMRTAWKYLSPRRRDMAELLLRAHDLDGEVDEALERVRQGNWLAERARHLRERVHDDDWLFARFGVYERPLAD